jgi:hypothetical protein
MAKIATKKVSKSAPKKVVKKPATKKAVAKTPATKKAVKKAVVKKVRAVDPNKYGKFYIVDIPTDKYPELVTITEAPKMYDDLIGRKYINRGKCMATIDAIRIGDSIEKGAKSVVKELDSVGLLPLEPADNEDEDK